MIRSAGESLRGARRRTPPLELVRPNWLFAGGSLAKLE